MIIELHVKKRGSARDVLPNGHVFLGMASSLGELFEKMHRKRKGALRFLETS